MDVLAITLFRVLQDVQKGKLKGGELNSNSGGGTNVGVVMELVSFQKVSFSTFHYHPSLRGQMSCLSSILLSTPPLPVLEFFPKIEM